TGTIRTTATDMRHEGIVNARLGWLLVGSGLLAACGAGDAATPPVTVRDSAGIAIVENVYPDSAAVKWWSLEQSPLLDIGGAQAEEAYSVYQVGGALRLSDDRIVVTNGGAADVRYYSADGEHVRTSGRRGDGPGEFQRPQQVLALPVDSVLVVDGGRATVLNPEGSYARDFTSGGTGPRTGVVGRLRDGRLVATHAAFTPGEIEAGFQRSTIVFVTLTPAGEVQDTIVTVPGAERTVHMEGSGGQVRSIMIIALPYVKNTVYAVAGDVLAVATQESPEIRVYGADGTPRRIIRTGTPMPAVTDAHLEAWFQRQRESMLPERREQAVTRPDWPDAGQVVPPFAAVEIDDAGNFWVADYDDRIRPHGAWSVHDPDGRLLARIRMPARFRPMHIGADFVLGVERDDLDVEHVRMYRVLKD
ncbi:MAG: hypothetical protein ACRELT_10945, partial [Longimicrobiales bacterium]